MISLQEFSYYLEVCREKNILAASKKLYVSQPLVTRVLKKMENEFGVTLIHRTTRSLNVTEAGSIVYEYAERMLSDYDEMLVSIESLSEKPNGRVRLNAAEIFIDCYMSDIMPMIVDKYPMIKLILTHDTTKNVVHTIIDGAADCGIIMLPLKETQLIEMKTLVEDELSVMVNTAHPYADHEYVDILDLKDKPLALFNKTTAVYDQFVAACKSAGFSPDIRYECVTPNVNVKIVENKKELVGIMPRPYISHYGNKNIVSVPLKPRVRWDIALVYRKDVHLSYATRLIIDEIHGLLTKRKGSDVYAD